MLSWIIAKGYFNVEIFLAEISANYLPAIGWKQIHTYTHAKHTHTYKHIHTH